MAKHYISNADVSVRMFEKDWMDYLSRVDYKVPLYIFVPVVIYFLYLSFTTVNLWYITPLIVIGLIVWTFTEYNLHRFVFHWQPPGKLGARLHFMFHGVHHAYPRDSKRLVMVPVVSVPLAVVFYFSFKFILTKLFGNPHFINPFFVGFVTGYLFYDMTHYALHHANFKSKFWLQLKQHHMIHHYSDPHNGFGVSTTFWDMVYRTTFKREKQAAEVGA
ncbi:MAG: sterol desaturase family protein [Chitinophagales bacterium]|nr:sterol desaturase family protein [Chitinophagales bacterium]MDW8418317.1 sterol desaturase family protein [Chitinophagales bacterium]